MIHPDRELWDKVGFNSEKYEYVKLPACVTKWLKRKVDNDILLSYYYYDNNKGKTMMLHYVSYDCGVLHPKGGYCSGQIDNPNQWESMAQDIAVTWPRYAVKKRNKKQIDEKN